MARKSYTENMYQHLKRQGYDKKYEHAGIYSISIGSQLVYIGKSYNMLKRVAAHYVAIKQPKEHKYIVLAEAQACGLPINFDVLYYAKASSPTAIKNEIGSKEGEYIRAHRPPLNYQIPKESDWTKFDTNPQAHTITLAQLLEIKTEQYD